MGAQDQQDEPGQSSLDINPTARKIHIGANELRLEPRAYDLLVLLAESAGKVREKRDLFDTVWAGRVVSDAALTQAITRIRRELTRCNGDSAWVRTVHGVGYAFDGPVSVSAPTGPDMPSPIPAAHRRTRAWAIVAVVVAMIAWLSWMLVPARPPPRIAISPFILDANAKDIAYGELALPQLLGDALEERADLTVVGPSRVRRGLANIEWSVDAKEAETARAIRDLFGVDHVLFARVGGSGDDLRLDWQLYGRNDLDKHGETRASGVGEMVRAASSRVAKTLDVAYAAGIPIRRLVSDEFVNEAFARGMQALLSGDSVAAEGYFNSALQTAPDTGWLFYERGNSRTVQGNFDAAAADYDRALELAKATGDRNLAGVAEVGLGIIEWRAGRLDDAQRRFEKARDIFQVVGNEANLAAAFGNLGILADNRGKLDGARELYDSALTLYRKEGDRAGESAVYSNLAVIARKRSRLDRAADLQLRALEIQRQIGLHQMTVFSATHLAEIERLRGRWEAAQSLLEEANVEAERAQDAVGKADILVARAVLATDMGDPDAASRDELLALTAYEQLDSAAGKMKVHLVRGERLFSHDADAAMKDFTLALGLATELGEEHVRLQAELRRAELGEGSFDAALAAAISQSQTQLDPVLAAQARWAAASHEDTLQAWERAFEQASAGNAAREQALLALELARQRIASGQNGAIDNLIGRAEAWRPDHPQTLALRACQYRLDGRLAESEILERRAQSAIGERAPSGWCPTESAARE